jgi:hypothetical protein
MDERLLERLAELEHEQWMAWSRIVADEVTPERRQRWEAMWVPYSQLPEALKEEDRVWARKVLAALAEVGAHSCQPGRVSPR